MLYVYVDKGKATEARLYSVTGTIECIDELNHAKVMMTGESLTRGERTFERFLVSSGEPDNNEFVDRCSVVITIGSQIDIVRFVKEGLLA
jgi:hypothetical protein